VSGSPAVRQERMVWRDAYSHRLPWVFWDTLSHSGWKPDTSWAKDLRGARTATQAMHVIEPLPINPSDWLQPYCCYSNTVIFYIRGTATEMARCDYSNRSWPQISFVERERLFYEVAGGRVVDVFGQWHMEWRAYKNTELARHFNGLCNAPCWFCDVLNFPEHSVLDPIRAGLPSAEDLDAVAREEEIRERTS